MKRDRRETHQRAGAAVFFLFCASAALHAEVKLPAILSSHMVLQRGQPIHVWGWAAAGEQVSAEINGSTGTTTADRYGQWNVFLPPQSAGGPYRLTVNGTNKIELEDVMLGDVWFASGQSNMEMPLSGFGTSALIANQQQEIRDANHSDLRLLLIPKKTSDFPLPDFEPTSWSKCTPETAAKFSAVAYFFGRDIAAREHVTVGLIDSSWGGTPGEAWISMHGLASDASLMPLFESWAQFSDAQTNIAAIEKAEREEDETARKAGKPLPGHPWHPDAGSWQPAALYNGMVAPAIGFPIKGAIWYQGESNATPDRAQLYAKVLPALIADWRARWQEGDFPFLFVQIANFETGGHDSTWSIVRDAQRRTLSVANTGMAVTIDIGDPKNIHPADKQDVGLRLGLGARRIAYGEDVEDSGPLFRKATTDGHTLRVWFDHTSGGLSAKGASALAGFEIAGQDKKFQQANAQIDGDTVVVSSDAIANPRYVRYAWESSPSVNLFNGKGLPASPFTSEEELPSR